MREGEPHRLADTPLGPITPYRYPNLLANHEPTARTHAAADDNIKQ
jgi:hypothetical protein